MSNKHPQTKVARGLGSCTRWPLVIAQVEYNHHSPSVGVV